jgi:hypothetical protein
MRTLLLILGSDAISAALSEGVSASAFVGEPIAFSEVVSASGFAVGLPALPDIVLADLLAANATSTSITGTAIGMGMAIGMGTANFIGIGTATFMGAISNPFMGAISNPFIGAAPLVTVIRGNVAWLTDQPAENVAEMWEQDLPQCDGRLRRNRIWRCRRGRRRRAGFNDQRAPPSLPILETIAWRGAAR